MLSSLVRCPSIASFRRVHTTEGPSHRPAMLGEDITATVCYTPSLHPPPLRVRFETALPLARRPSVRELLYLPNPFGPKAAHMCTQILQEFHAMPATTPRDLLIPLHKGCHVGSPYKELSTWQRECPTIGEVIRVLQEGFSMQVQASRLNWYQDHSQWKPFHHDAHAFAGSAKYGPSRGVDRNYTLIASFGATRQFALQHCEYQVPSGSVCLDAGNGSVIGLGRDVNILWRHGILKGVRGSLREGEERQRISFVLNGWVEQEEEVDNEL